MMAESGNPLRWPEVFAALASEPRLRIVKLLARGEVRCQDILPQLELSQPAVSYHLAKLERAGILAKERQGTRNCYRLCDEVRTLIRMITKEDKEWTTR
jgi:DNA-binding transcriptional ArsR family regulator